MFALLLQNLHWIADNCIQLAMTWNSKPIFCCRQSQTLTPHCRWLIADRLWICTIFWSRKSHGKSVLKKRGHFVCDIWLTVCHDAVYMLVSVCPSSPSNDDWRIRRNIIRIVLCWTEYYGCALIRTHVFEPLLQMDVGLGLFMLKFVCYFASLNRSSLFVRVSFCVFQ